MAVSINYHGISQLLSCLGLREFDLVVVLENCYGGHVQYSQHSREWNEQFLGSTTSCFKSEQEGVESEVALYEFFEKCIIPMAETKRLLIISNCSSENSLAHNLDLALQKAKQHWTKRWENLEVLCICNESAHYTQTMVNKESFEYKLRLSSQSWPKRRTNEKMLVKNVDDQYNDLQPNSAKRFQLLPNANH